MSIYTLGRSRGESVVKYPATASQMEGSHFTCKRGLLVGKKRERLQSLWVLHEGATEL